MTIIIQAVLLVVGLFMLVKGADLFVDGASDIATKFGIPQLVVGLTIVAIGTSLPELSVSITAATKGNAGITLGNVLGSNILNVLVILGITSTIVPILIPRTALKYDIPFCTFVTVVVLALGWIGGELMFLEGMILLLLFVGYSIYLFFLSRGSIKKEKKEKKPSTMPMWKCLFFVILGGVCVVFGSDLTVDSATAIARTIGLSERIIGLTIIAFGTSLPELVTSVMAARKGNADIAIGNVIGSNLFNILFVTGLTATISTIPFEKSFVVDSLIAILALVILWIGSRKHRELRRPCGLFMLGVYAVYFVVLTVL
ncbi:MAG: calcium/sodium antiporter [Lachnospiraceae bacterium]